MAENLPRITSVAATYKQQQTAAAAAAVVVVLANLRLLPVVFSKNVLRTEWVNSPMGRLGRSRPMP